LVVAKIIKATPCASQWGARRVLSPRLKKIMK